jgi:hypothetical protein
MGQVNAMFNYGGLLRMVKMDVLVMFYDPVSVQTPSQPDIYLPTLAGNAIYA